MNACPCVLFNLTTPPLIFWCLPTRVRARSKAYRRVTFGLDSVVRTEGGLSLCGRVLSLVSRAGSVLVRTGTSRFTKVYVQVGILHCAGLQGVIRPVLKHGPRSPYTCASMWVKTHMRNESDCGDISTHDRPRSTERGLSVSTSVGTRKMVNYV